MLGWATENAHEGCRNNDGSWVARRCKRAGLTEDQAETWMRRYQESVTDLGHAYTWREAAGTLRSVYRARERTVG